MSACPAFCTFQQSDDLSFGVAVAGPISRGAIEEASEEGGEEESASTERVRPTKELR
jgi:hypothetical protein